jgi:hypothetical protein
LQEQRMEEVRGKAAQSGLLLFAFVGEMMAMGDE